MLDVAKPSYEALYRDFRWRLPPRYNIGVDVCDKHADDPTRLALIVEGEDGRVSRYGFSALRELSNRFANALRELGLRRGDRVGVLLPQSVEVAVAHVASFKSGLISLPLFSLFGSEALHYRLSDSGARVVVTDKAGVAKLGPIRRELPGLTAIICVEGAVDDALDFHALLEANDAEFTPVDTAPDDPAVIIYTSGTTGNPKGALHGHRILLGHLPGVEMPHELFPQPGDLFWTPADWAWIGGLFDVLMPAWHHGIPVLARRFRKFDAHQAIELMTRHSVRNTFLPPTALKLMRQAGVGAAGVKLRTLASGGESLGAELIEWARATFGVTINEFYGQTECNVVVGNCASVFPGRPGSMGRAIPGHRVGVVDEKGLEVPPGTVGSIAIERPDPVMFLGYWNKPEATAAKFIGDWMLTGDLGHQDEDGYFWYVGRDDDVITSAGYRIGPGEIEECLLRHPSVALAAAVGVPDRVRTEIVMAYLVLRPGVVPSEELKAEIQEFVRARLAAYEYPRRISFVEELPMTATGKIIRRVLRQRAIDEASG
jgi:acetyl-CoA synthetase